MCIRDSIYAALQTLRWIKAEGGVKEMERRAIEKADMLYACLLYTSHTLCPLHYREYRPRGACPSDNDCSG